MSTAKKPPKNRSTTGKGRELTQFKPGESGNPTGRPFGSRNRKTVIMAAMVRIAENKDMTPEEIEEAIQVAGIEKALKGSFFHYQEVSNGFYGKITDKSEIEVKGKTLADIIAAAATAKKKPAASTNAKRATKR